MEVTVNDVLESVRLSSKADRSSHLSFPWQELKHENPKGVYIALLSESSCGSVFRGKVAHGRTWFERGENEVVGEEVVEAAVGK